MSVLLELLMAPSALSLLRWVQEPEFALAAVARLGRDLEARLFGCEESCHSYAARVIMILKLLSMQCVIGTLCVSGGQLLILFYISQLLAMRFAGGRIECMSCPAPTAVSISNSQQPVFP